MRKLTIIVLLLAAVLLGFSSAASPRVALVLSGGVAARGLSEIGVIKALEEAGIPVDYVAGTSMGAVLGSLLAQGYSADEIGAIVRSIDWLQAFVQASDYQNLLFGEKENYGKYLLNLELDGFKPLIPKSLINAQKPSVIFTGISLRALEINDFDKLKVPFRANATDLESGDEVVFSSGYLPKVLQASSAVPLMFPPVELDGRLLIDGGAVNNLPVNLVREFQPDVIVAVNLGGGLKKKRELNSIIAILNQNLAFLQRETVAKHRQEADILIEPQIDAYSFSDFDKLDEIIEVGYRAAKAQMPRLLKLLKAKGYKPAAKQTIKSPAVPVKSVAIVGESLYPKWVLYGLLSSEANAPLDPRRVERDRRALENKYLGDGYALARVASSFEAESGRLTFKVYEGRIRLVEFVGRRNISELYLKDKIKYRPIFNKKEVEENIDQIYASGNFSSVNYRAVAGPSGYTLQYLVQEKNYNNLAVGLHYDTYEQLSLLADLTLSFSKTRNFKQIVSLKVGNEYNYELNTEFAPNQFGQDLIGGFDLFYGLINQDIYGGTQVASTYGILSAGGSLRLIANIEPVGQVTGGLEVFKASYQRLFSLLPDENIAKLYLRTKIDSLDNPILPKKGVLVGLEYQQGLRTLGG
ncbi:MAG: patatin-like phospholipase family protein, partial [Candidatus Peribacteraceae bacterium]